MDNNTIKYFNFNVTFKVSKDDTFSEVITFTPNGDNPINLFLDIENKTENKYSFPNDTDLPNIKKFNRLLHYDFKTESDLPYLSLEYNSMFVNEYKSNGSGFDFYNGSDIAGKIEVYNVTGVFKTEDTGDGYCKIWFNEDLWKNEPDDPDLKRFNYSFVVYFIDKENDLLAEKDVRIPSIYRPFYMQNYIILSSNYVRYMFNINNAVGLKDENRYYIGDVETSIQVNDKNKIDFGQNLYLYLRDTPPLLFKNYNLSRDTTSGEGTESSETITLKYKIQFKEKEPDFSHPDFLINSVYEENNLSFYGIKYSVNPIEINKNDKKQWAAQIYINQVKGTSSNGIRYFVTNMEFSKLVNDVNAITVPPENYDLYPSDIRGDKEYGREKFYYGGVYSFHKIFKTAPDDASIDSQNYSNRYAYELKNLYEYTEFSEDGYYILTYKVPKDKTEKDITKANFHIVAIYDPVTLLSDDDMIQEQLYSKILKPHNNFTSIMRIY